MARRWLITVITAVALVIAAVIAARAIRDDETVADRTTTAAAAPSPSITSAGSTTTSAPTPATTTATVAPATVAPPGPCGVDTGAIRAAIDAAVAGAQAGADVAICRLAASDTTWAAVRLNAKPGAQFAAVTVIVHADGVVGGARSWTIVATGGTNAGCGQAPQQVIVDLGQFCAGTGGGNQ